MAQIYKLEWQPDLFDSEQTGQLRQELAEVRASTDRVRKALFARNNELSREIQVLQQDMEILKRYICRGDDGKTN